VAANAELSRSSRGCMSRRLSSGWLTAHLSAKLDVEHAPRAHGRAFHFFRRQQSKRHYLLTRQGAVEQARLEIATYALHTFSARNGPNGASPTSRRCSHTPIDATLIERKNQNHPNGVTSTRASTNARSVISLSPEGSRLLLLLPTTTVPPYASKATERQALTPSQQPTWPRKCDYGREEPPIVLHDLLPCHLLTFPRVAHSKVINPTTPCAFGTTSTHTHD